ncbi:hypothetical protein AB0M32_42080 [Streptomyces sp. NPDC051985]|uniref:hypothetical protein n=1 Tax=Streptomyces sp. NPDC051985 TaxID=3155807 RepID=UPI00343D589A
MEIRRLCTGADGRSELGEIEVYADDESVDRVPAAAVTLVRKHGVSRSQAPAPRRDLVVFLSGRTRVVDGRGNVADFGPGDLLLREDVTGEGHEEHYLGEVQHLVIHCPEYVPAAPADGERARWAPEPGFPDKFGGPTLSRVTTRGEETDLVPLVWPDDLRSEERPVAEWQPVDYCRFVEHAGIAVGPQGVQGDEPQPTAIGWHLTRQRCLYVVLSGQARTYVSSGPSLLRRPGDVQLSEDLAGKGHFNMFSGRGAGLVIFLPDDSLVLPAATIDAGWARAQA